MLINLTNHPKDTWSEKQTKTALRKYKSIYDIPFPNISPNASTSNVKRTALKYFKLCINVLKNSKDKNNAVHLMGEFTFVYHLVNMLKKRKIPVVVSTSNRIVYEEQGKKVVTFNFVRFREY